MHPPIPGITCRRARLSDYSSVLAINRDLYSGMDPLPAKYERFINEPDRLLYVMEKNKKIIAFTLRFFVDGGETGVNEVGRILPELQGEGMMNYLIDYIDADTKKHFPKMKRTAWTSINREITDMLVRKNPLIKLKVVRPRLTFLISPEKMRGLFREPIFSRFQHLSTLDQACVTRTLTPSEAVSMLTHIPDMTSFVPEKQLIVDWEPFRPQVSNYKYITKYSTVFVSYEKSNPDVVTSFSFGTYVRVKGGIRHTIDFYCHRKHSNAEAILVHIQKHISMLYQHKFNESINVSVLLPRNMDQSLARQVLVEELRLGPLPTEQNFVNDALVIEMNVNERLHQSKL